MDKNKWSKFITYKFKLPKSAKVIFYRHPKEFSYMEIERINPNHKIIIWGKQRKKYSSSNSTHKIKLGRIFIPLIAYMYMNNYTMLKLFASLEFILPFISYVGFALFFVYAFITYPAIHKKHPIIGLIQKC